MDASGELVRFHATVRTTAEAQAVFDTLLDLPSHLEWAGARSRTKTFRLLTVEAAAEPATVGTTFTSTGASHNGTFHDTSVVTEAAAYTFAFDTTSTLDRRRGAAWHVTFSHRFQVISDRDGGARIDYACSAHDADYVPYWLKPGARALTRSAVNRLMTRHLHNLAQLAEQRAASAGL